MSKEINWQTRDQVAKAAEHSKKAAWECAIVHWQQMEKATIKQLLEAHPEKVAIIPPTCALCQRYPDCKGCPINCSPEAGRAFRALSRLAEGKTQVRVIEWKKAVRAMLAKLVRGYVKTYPKTYDKELVAK